MANPGLIVAIAKLAAALADMLSKMNNNVKVSVGIENESGVDLIYKSSTFNSGRWEFSPPPVIPNNQAGAMGGEDKDGSIGTGVQGIVIYEAKDKSFSAIFAFDNPFIGSYKTACSIGAYGKFSNNDLDDFMDKLSQDGNSEEYNGYRVTTSGGAPEEIFSVLKI